MVQAWGQSIKPFDQDEEEEMERAIKAKSVRKPEMPTQKEIDEHMITHTPFKAWCPHCVAGHSSCGYHFRRREPEEDNAIPSAHIDYMYMKSQRVGDQEEEDDRESMPILVMSDQ